MDTIIPLIVQVICGGAGGKVAGAFLNNANLSGILQAVVGAVGGVGGGQLVSMLGILQSLFGDSSGGNIAGNAGASAVGGALLTVIVGLIKQSMNKPAA